MPTEEQPSKPNLKKDEEYELVPITPIRRIEKRVDMLERDVSTESVRDLVKAIRSNQQVAEEVMKLNTDMIRRVSDLTASVGELTIRINDLVSRLQVSENSEKPKESESALEARLDKLERRLNAMIISTVARRRVAPGGIMPMA